MTTCPACSYEWKSKTRKPRSLPQLRRFFGMVRAAFNNWPLSFKELQPRDPEHLRKWLTAKAGFVERTIIEPPPAVVADDERIRKLALLWMEQSIAAVRSGEDYTWIRRHGDNIVVFIPQSIAFELMGHNEFGALNDDVSNLLENIIGMDGDELLQNNQEVA